MAKSCGKEVSPPTMSPITDKKVLRSQLAAHQHRPRRSAGQNFLVCAKPVTKTVEALPKGLSTVVELGAGAGALTEALLEQGHQVVAIERDSTLVTILNERLLDQHREQLTIVADDLRHTPWEQPAPYGLVGNIPYNLSGLIFRRLPKLHPQPEQVILLVQREVGQRLLAAPPAMSLLSVAVQLWGMPTRLQSVPAGCFWPQPDVDSVLVAITPHAHQLDRDTYQSVINVARTGFGTKRKQLGGSLRRGLGLAEAEIITQLEAVGLAPAQRPEVLSIEQSTSLATSLTK